MKAFVTVFMSAALSITSACTAGAGESETPEEQDSLDQLAPGELPQEREIGVQQQALLQGCPQSLIAPISAPADSFAPRDYTYNFVGSVPFAFALWCFYKPVDPYVTLSTFSSPSAPDCFSDGFGTFECYRLDCPSGQPPCWAGNHIFVNCPSTLQLGLPVAYIQGSDVLPWPQQTHPAVPSQGFAWTLLNNHIEGGVPSAYPGAIRGGQLTCEYAALNSGYTVITTP